MRECKFFSGEKRTGQTLSNSAGGSSALRGELSLVVGPENVVASMRTVVFNPA
jgi:hypothetical protein